MTPEDKIVEAIDRNTKEVSDSLSVVRLMLAIIIGLLLSIAIPLRGATIFLPEASQPPMFDIGDPPKPPANPHIQHWYTMDVPGPDGVLPIEVFSPRLFSPVASVGYVEVDVPEPVTAYILIALVLIAGAAKCVMIYKLYRLRCEIYDAEHAGVQKALAEHNAVVARWRKDHIVREEPHA